jgi:alkylation response protein AidB-like acyl-CoA dehydrogenase
MNAISAFSKAWADVQSLRPIVEAHRDEGEQLRRMPQAIYRAFLERDVYRLTLPADLGGAGLDPLEFFDLTLEVGRYDGSTGWLFWLAGETAFTAGKLPPEMSREMFGTPACGGAGSGPPTGRAVATEGGYRVTGRWAWASGIHQARFVAASCIVYDGDTLRPSPQGGPTVLQALVPIDDVQVLDTWNTGGMRATGSTEFVMEDVFVPSVRAFAGFGGELYQPHPRFKLPTSYFGFGLAAVALGVAYSTVDALKALALGKRLPPPRGLLAEQASAQFTVAKTEAMVEAAHLGVRDAGARLWTEVCAEGEATVATRARLRRHICHVAETCIEAVSLCYREAGGSAVFQAAPFERALRDIHTIGGHAVVQRVMMEDAGRAALGLKTQMGMF